MLAYAADLVQTQLIQDRSVAGFERPVQGGEEDVRICGFFLAACPSMREVYNRVRLLASVEVPMLTLGESGVGKEVVSLLLHKHSARSR